jgi:WD40 repeat protein
VLASYAMTTDKPSLHLVDTRCNTIHVLAQQRPALCWPHTMQHLPMCPDALRRVSSVAFVSYGPSARLVVGCDDGTARCWDWQAGGCLAAAKAKSKAELTAVVAPPW